MDSDAMILADQALVHAVQNARMAGLTHGHVIVLAHIPDLAGDHQENTAIIGAGISDDPERDRLDVDDPATVVASIATHLTELIRKAGVPGVHVLIDAPGQDQ